MFTFALALFSSIIAQASPFDSIKPEVSQVLVVSSRGGVKAELELLERSPNHRTWTSVEKFPAVIGLAGFAPPGAKHEGDHKSPTGVFALSQAWGYGSQNPTRMPYRSVTREDKFVDDVDSNQYNTWVHGPTTAKSFEFMRREDELYEYGVVIDYNMNPVVAGRGSAIFLHVWRSGSAGTEGCVAVEKKNLLKILAWLDPKRSPSIVLNPSGANPQL